MDTADVVAIREVLARAYADDPLTEWIFRDPSTRVHACGAWYGLFVEAYVRTQRVTWLPDERAACLWSTPDDQPLPWADIPSPAGLLAALVGDEHAQRIGDALHPIGTIQPDRPHVYVNFLAVESPGHGAGANALAPALEEARARGIGVSVESTNPRNHAFYERLGFTRRTTFPLGDGPELVAFWLD